MNPTFFYNKKSISNNPGHFFSVIPVTGMINGKTRMIIPTIPVYLKACINRMVEWAWI